MEVEEATKGDLHAGLDSKVGEKRRTFRVIKGPDGTFNDRCQKCYLEMEKVFPRQINDGNMTGQ